MSNLAMLASTPPMTLSKDLQHNHAHHPTGGGIMHLNIWQQHRSLGPTSRMAHPNPLMASATQNDNDTSHFTPAHQCNTSSHQISHTTIVAIPPHHKQNDTVFGAPTPSPSGTMPTASSSWGPLLAGNDLSTCALTYCMLTTHYYALPVPGSTWHHHICNYQTCKHLSKLH